MGFLLSVSESRGNAASLPAGSLLFTRGFNTDADTTAGPTGFVFECAWSWSLAMTCSIDCFGDLSFGSSGFVSTSSDSTSRLRERSNMVTREPVGGIGAESTASAAIKAPIASILLDRRAAFIFGEGLTLRLAASVAAMRLGLFAPSFVAGDGELYPRPRCDSGDDAGEAPDDGPAPSCCSLAATRPAGDASESISGMLPPVTCGARD